VVDPEDRELTISCGAAVFHLRIALGHFGYAGAVEFPQDDSGLLARIRVGARREASEQENSMFRAINQRRTNRLPFTDTPVPESLLAEFRGAVREEGTWLRVIEGEGQRNKVADLIAQGDQVQMADQNFRRELASWMHSSRSNSRDGLPGYAFGYSQSMDFLTPVVSLIVRTFDMGQGQAAKDRQLATGSPVLAVLGTDQDTKSHWLAAGQALARVLLLARSQGVWASFLNQPIEVPQLRAQLKEALELEGSPQLLLRMGYGQEVSPTPRRPVREVL
jgi:hypothetical protein